MRTASHVMVGVDGTWKRTGAVEWALDEALRSGAPLRVLHLADAGHGRRPRFTPDSADEDAEHLVSAIRDHVQRTAPMVRVSGDASWGNPGAALAEAALDARMLVVGKRGAGTFGRLLIGSTAESAVATATVPVVVVPQRWRPAEHRTGPVLLGVDATAPSTAA